MHGYGGDMSIMAASALFIVVLQCVYLAERRREKGAKRKRKREKGWKERGENARFAFFYLKQNHRREKKKKRLDTRGYGINTSSEGTGPRGVRGERVCE